MRASHHRPIEAHDLAKRFGAVTAIDGLSLHLDEGEALGLLGPNGAGKSTALAMLMGLRAPDEGTVQLFGHPPGSAAARAMMGVTPQAAGFPDQLTPRELLAYATARRGGAVPVDDAIAAFGLAPLVDRRMAGFSGGEVRRVALALAFLGRPGLVFLDEPTAGLDAEAQQAFQATARAYVGDGGALILTSHHWDEIEAVCDRITMIDKGRKVMDGTLAEIRARMQVRRINFALPETARPPAWLRAMQKGGRWLAESDDSDASLRRLLAEGTPFADLTVEPLALQDIIARIRPEDRP
jgi:ABC-2 type transport system ATP-binding protein